MILIEVTSGKQNISTNFNNKCIDVLFYPNEECQTYFTWLKLMVNVRTRLRRLTLELTGKASLVKLRSINHFLSAIIANCLPIMRDQYANMRCFARLGTICTIQKTWKTPMDEWYFSKIPPWVFFTLFILYKW